MHRTHRYGPRGLLPSAIVSELEPVPLRDPVADLGDVHSDALGDPLGEVVREAQALPGAQEFVLDDLTAFARLCAAGPSGRRAALGRAFNAAVREGQVAGVARATAWAGAAGMVLKFRERSAVYVTRATV